MSSPSFQLVMRAGPTPGKSFALSKSEVVIGRDLSVDVVINAAEISRRHTMLRFQNGTYIVEDLGSTNGTFVNGQRLSAPHVLRPGEMIMLGEAVTLVFEAAQSDPNATVISPASERPAMYPPPHVMAQPAPPIQPAPRPAPVQAAPPAGSYTGQVPAGPPPLAPAKASQNRTWLWAGVGCLVVVLCVVVVGGVIFDALDLYCTPPFNSLFGFLYDCP